MFGVPMLLFWVASGKWFRQALAAKLTEDRQILYGARATWSKRVQNNLNFLSLVIVRLSYT
jgi:hypothetical protein